MGSSSKMTLMPEGACPKIPLALPMMSINIENKRFIVNVLKRVYLNVYGTPVTCVSNVAGASKAFAYPRGVGVTGEWAAK